MTLSVALHRRHFSGRKAISKCLPHTALSVRLNAKSRCRCDSFLLHRGGRIANGDALIQILLKERLESAESLILQRVDKLVEHQSAVAPAVRPDEYPISQGESAGARRDKLSRLCGRTKTRM